MAFGPLHTDGFHIGLAPEVELVHLDDLDVLEAKFMHSLLQFGIEQGIRAQPGIEF